MVRKGDSTSERLKREWVPAQQDRHFCHCGCREPIIIRWGHFYKGIPQFKHHHNDTTMLATPEQKQEVADLYRSGIGVPEIARRFGAQIKTVQLVLQRLNVKIRNKYECQRKYALNERVFLDKKPGWKYWVGFLLADGCILNNKKGFALVLALAEEDKAHVAKFRDFLETEIPISISAPPLKFANAQNSVRIHVSSTPLCKSLMDLGVVPRKSTREVLHSSLVEDAEAWRGVIDGDGWVTCHDRGHNLFPVVGLVGSLELLTQFKAFVTKITGREKAFPRPMGSIWHYSLGGRWAAQVIDALYTGSSIHLDRKKAIADRTKSEYAPLVRSWHHLTADTLDELRVQHGSWSEVALSIGMLSSNLATFRRKLGMATNKPGRPANGDLSQRLLFE